MKNRFNFNDEDNFPEDLFPGGGGEFEDEGEREEEPYEAYDREADEIAQAIELERRDLNQKILFRTIKTLEKGLLWKFRSEAVRQKMISEAYIVNQRLITQGEYQYVDHTRSTV
jgi:hypothetical protein